MIYKLLEATMHGQDVGYIRVSTADQNTARQLDGINLNEKFEDTTSGKDTKRPKLEACMKHCRKGDTLHVHSIDRLARNLTDLQHLVEELTSKGVTVHFHKEGLTFSGADEPTSKLMLQLIGAVAEFERAMINERRKEGVAIAMKKGVKFGRPAKLTAEQIMEAKKMIKEGINKKSVAELFGVSRPTLYATLRA